MKKPILALIGVLAMLLAGLFFATASADAYPPGTPPTLSVSDTSPTCGESVTVSGSHFQPGETVTITQGGKSYTVTADGSGSFTTSITINCPNGTAPGAITATGNSSGDVASISLTSGGGTTGGGNAGGGGNLSTTGVAVIGIGALGVVLLIGGGLLLLAGRRRNTSAA